MSTHDQLHGSDGEIQDELIGMGPEPVPGVRWSPGWRTWAVAGTVAVLILAGAFWRGVGAETHVPLAVPPHAAIAAGQAVEGAGVPVAWRGGHPWVPIAHAARSAEVAAASMVPTRPGRTVTPAAGDDGLFLSSEAARSKRLGATMGAIEQMIESQAGVSRAQVVLAEAVRPGAPGSAYAGPSAAATVTMTEGEMSQNLVDAVAALVSGSLPGLAPERVVVIDANANRRRSPRSVEERQAADARAERALVLAERLRTAVPPGSEVSVTVDPDHAAHAVVVLSSLHAQRVVETHASLPPDIALAAEEARVITLAEGVLPRSGDGMPARVVVTQALVAADSVLEERTPPAERAGDPIAAAMERELATPLGTGVASTGAWDSGTFILLSLAVAAVGGAIVFARRRGANAAVPALAGLDGDHAYDPGAPALRSGEFPETTDASDAVRADPDSAVAVVRAWLDAGYEARAAHLVVALDSGAAGALLRAMPPNAVRRVTEALGTLRTPTAGELRAACDSLVEELEMLHDPGPGAHAAVRQNAAHAQERA